MTFQDQEPGAPEAPQDGGFAPAPMAPRMPVPPPTRPRAATSRALNVVLGVAVVVAVAGIAFAAGRLTVPAAASTGGFGNRPGNGGYFPGFVNGGNGNGALGGGGVIEGTIVAVGADSLTIRIGGTANGGQGLEIQIPISASTAVHTQASATSGDLSAGQKILVQLGTPTTGATAAPAASGAPRAIQQPATDVTIVAP